MRITNKYGLPGALVEAIKNDSYDAGDSDISVTTLISPPKIRVLSKAHSGEMEEDASDRIYALVGQAVHSILERAEPSAIVEKRLYMDVLGWKVGGQFDRMTLRQVTLQDFKLCSVWEYIFGLKPERVAQLNVLAELCHQNGFTDIRKIEVVAIFRDWMKSKAKFDKDYPQAQVQRINVPLWDKAARLAYIKERVRLHQEAEKGRVIDCTASERWATDDTWAVMKGANKRAAKVCKSEHEAEEWINGRDGFSVQLRKGVSKRCEDYCPVKDWCDQYKDMKED